MEQKDLQHIANQFEITGTVAEVKPLGNGLINTTYKVTTAEADAPDYVLQHRICAGHLNLTTVFRRTLFLIFKAPIRTFGNPDATDFRI